MKSWKKLTIPAICAVVFVIVISAMVAGIQKQPSPDIPAAHVAGPLICEAGGPFNIWIDLFDGTHPYKTALVRSSGPDLYTTYMLVPILEVPFNAPESCLAVVYQTVVDGKNAWFFGYKVASGWWLIGYEFYTRDQVIVNFMLELAGA